MGARAQLEKKMAAKEKEAKESKLRDLAQKAREERAGIRPQKDRGTGRGEDGGERERDELRKDRHRERARQRNLERAAPGTRSKLERNRERDVSEQIALGLPAKTAAAQGADGLFDSRLFNQSRGLNSGYDDDEGYNVYSEPWRNNSSISQSIYRPGKNVDKEAYGGAEDLDNLKKTSRFVADKGFEGTERGAGTSSRSGPVQFERNEEEDPFGLDQFLATAKSASNKRSNDDSADKRRGDDRDRSDRKRRRV